ncbi:hypothetical protein SAMN04487898_10527 [Pedobacter sp. ok626]|uniref:hypothetical protein n=1 Tax=Pedobacter sp. ok626 TaxID=1761882 RepID=UPI000885BB2F|nr:hypothetical protein [Pedobacter sp. ok626]SDJ90964.1 hypothetical protein SAMN04487898_10527 [Pedobacter sp. ok626]
MGNLKHHHFAALFALLFVLACKKSRNTKIEIPEPEPPVIIKTLVPIKLEAAGLIINLKYKENTTLLTEISEGEGSTKTVITYNAAQYPIALEKYKSSKLFYKVNYRLEDKKVINKVLIFDYKELLHTYTPRGYYTISYNDLQQLSSLHYYNNSDNLIEAQSYIKSGNLSTVTTTNDSGFTNIHTYTFDQKKGIASSISYAQLFTIESEHWFLSYYLNNLLNYRNQKSPSENTDFSYEYNTDGYPSKMMISKDKNTQSIKITYKSIEL